MKTKTKRKLARSQQMTKSIEAVFVTQPNWVFLSVTTA